MILEINGTNAGVFPSGMRVREGNRRVAFDNTADPDKGQQLNRAGGFEPIGTASFSAKKRQPTMMPYNLPGDEIDYLEKSEDPKKHLMLLNQIKTPQQILFQYY